MAKLQNKRLSSHGGDLSRLEIGENTARNKGQSIESTPQGSVGFRCLLDKRWSPDFEGIYHHISNAGLDERNAGVNAVGGFIGVSYIFGAK
jgi:hypothetical protein